MRRKGILLLLLGGLALSACTAQAPPDADRSETTAPSVASPSREPSPTALPAPSPDPLEIARVTFDNTSTPSVNAGITGPSLNTGVFRIEGDCSGTSFDYRLRDASVDAGDRDIVSGRITCGADYAANTMSFDMPTSGPVQLIVEDVRADAGWVRAVLAE